MTKKNGQMPYDKTNEHTVSQVYTWSVWVREGAFFLPEQSLE